MKKLNENNDTPIIGTVIEDNSKEKGSVMVAIGSGQLTVDKEITRLNKKIKALEGELLEKIAKIYTLENEIQKYIISLSQKQSFDPQLRDDFKPLYEKMEKEFTRTRTNGFLAILRSVWSRMNK